MADRTTDFFRHESCGKCTPCREGTHWLGCAYARLLSDAGAERDTSVIAAVLRQMEGASFCPLGEFSLAVPRSTIEHFPHDYARHASPPEKDA